MSTAIDLKGTSMRTVRVLTLALVGLCVLAVSAARAAVTPAPSPKALAVTAPTHLPPRQSEVQRVTVEAEGGTFQLGINGGKGKATPVSYFGFISATAGSPVATINSTEGDGFEVGARVTNGGLPFEGEAFVVSCSSDCSTPGSTVTFSEPAEETTNEEVAIIYPKKLTVEEGEFSVGSELGGPIFAPGTVVTALEGALATLSKPTTSQYRFYETERLIPITQKSAPIAYDAPASTVQSALEAVPAIGAGSVTVSGGPGGDARPAPTSSNSTVPCANEDVAEVIADKSALTGAHPFAHVFTTIPGGVGTGEIVVMLANIGGLPSSGLMTVKVGPLPPGIVTTGSGKGTEWECPGAGAGQSTITCTTAEPLRVLHASPNALSVPIEVDAGAPASATVPVELSGGGTLRTDTFSCRSSSPRNRRRSGYAAAWAGSFEADGSPSLQAGGHPYPVGSLFHAQHGPPGQRRTISPAGDSKDVAVDLPPGFTGNPLAGKRCPQSVVISPGPGLETVQRGNVGRQSRPVHRRTRRKPEAAVAPLQRHAAERRTRPSSPPGSPSPCRACWRASTAKKTSGSAWSDRTTLTSTRSTASSPASKGCRNSAMAPPS